MQIGGTKVIADIVENPFKDYSTNIIGNITSYSSSQDEAEEEKKRRENEEKKKERR